MKNPSSSSGSSTRRSLPGWAMIVPALLISTAVIFVCYPVHADQSVPVAASLNPEERQWLSQHDEKIRIGITVIPPQIVQNTGRYEGLSIDFIDLLQRKLGCRFRLVPYATWNEVIEAAKARQIDMIFAAQQTPERAEYLLFTAPYIETPNMIIVRKDRKGGDDLSRMKGWSIAVSEGSAVHEYLKKEYGYLDLHPVHDELSGLMKVSMGEVDAMVVEFSRASYYIERAGIVNLRVAGTTGLLYQLRFAVRNDWPVLREILDKGLTSVSEEERRSINRRWIIVGSAGILSDRTARIWVLAILGVILVACAGVIIWNRTLRQTVRARTAELRDKLEEHRQADRRMVLMNFALNSVHEAAFLTDVNARFHYVNEESCRLLGYSRDELLGMAVYDLDPDFPQGRWPEHWNELKALRSIMFESRHRTKDGRVIPVEINANYFEYDGQSYNLALVRDITERKRIEGDLKMSQFIIDNASIGIMQGNDDAKILSANEHCARVLGYSREEFGTMSFFDIDPNLTPESWQEHRKRLVAAGFNVIESVHRRKDGSVFPVEVTINYLKFNNQDVSCAFIRDITERKAAEEERQSHLNFLTCMDGINRAIQGTNDLEQMMSDVLDTMLSIFSCDRAFLATPCDPSAAEFKIAMERTTPVYPGAFARGVAVPMSSAVRTLFNELLSNPVPNEIYIGKGLDPDDIVWKTYEIKSQLSIALYPKVGGSWECGLHQCSYNRVWTPQEKKLFLEISRRLADGLTSLLTYRNLQESEARYRKAQSLGHVGNWEYNLQTAHFWGSDEAKRIYGFDPGKHDLSTDEVENCIPERERVHQALVDLIETGKKYSLEFDIIPRNSTEPRTIVSIAELKRDENGNPLKVEGVIQDITARKQAEEAFRRSEEKYRRIVETTSEGIWMLGPDLTTSFVNARMAGMIGYSAEELMGRSLTDFIYAEDAAHHSIRMQNRRQGMSENYERRLRHKDGKTIWTYISATPVLDEKHRFQGTLAMVSDITGRKTAEEEKRKLEGQLRQAQKMEAIGTLAGGVAHDFNNILTAIMGYGDILKANMRPDDPQRSFMDEILASAQRAAQLTQGLLAFSRKQVINPKPVDVNQIVKSIEQLLRRLIGEDVELSVHLSGQSLIVMADTGQIDQVLMNLATNARDAMPDGGVLEIATQEIFLGDDFFRMHGPGKAGKYVLITVSDTGAGIDEQTRAKIFEPFFTTKEPGKGTGLGLSIVYGIVKHHNGIINVYSEQGRGTTFKIYLPLIVQAVEKDAAEVAPPRGTETILLAEDDIHVRHLTNTVLNNYGYRVIEAVDGQDAVDKFSENSEKINLLLLDVIMPRKSGKEAADIVRTLNPDARILFLSGYTADLLEKKGLSGSGFDFVSKPIRPFELLHKVREILDRKSKADPNF